MNRKQYAACQARRAKRALLTKRINKATYRDYHRGLIDFYYYGWSEYDKQENWYSDGVYAETPQERLLREESEQIDSLLGLDRMGNRGPVVTAL